MLTREMADDIVRETMNTLNRNINVMDDSGIILSSGDRNRIDSFHEGALKVIESGEPVYISAENVSHMLGTQPGVNFPIKFQEKVVGVVGISGTPEEVGAFGAIVVKMTEMMIGQIVLLNEVDWKYRTREFLLEELLNKNPSTQKIDQKCRLLGIELSGPLDVIVLKMYKPSTTLVLKNVYEYISQEVSEKHSVAGYIDSETFVIVAGDALLNNKRIAEKCRLYFSGFFDYVLAGCGHQASSLTGIHEVYKEIVTALKLSDGKTVHVKDMEAMVALSDVNMHTKETFQKRVLQSLSHELKQTMILFFKNDLNISETAKKLFIHRNTLTYRLDKIAEISGYDPRSFHHAFALQLAVWFENDCSNVHKNNR